MPVFNIWIEPTTDEKDLTEFLNTALFDFCEKHNLEHESADELCASVIGDGYPHLDEDTKKKVITWLKSFVTVWEILARTDIIEKLQTEII
tara:strand:- start:431 stop:703 length:273 start_codon:yes stop_codon:yes gene_type:complete